jgi:thiol-disulfide isomerase/thioredoxin
MSEEEFELTPENLKRTLSQAEKALLVVYSENCPSCDYYDDIVQKVEEKVGDKVGTIRITIGQDANSEELVKQFNIMHVPTAIVFERGEVKRKIVPKLRPKEDEDELLRSLG